MLKENKITINKEEAEQIKHRYLSNYVYLQEVASELDEDTALKALQLERDGKNREQILNRLHAVYSKKRRERERKDLGL